jgi:hypothetical protein
MTARQGGRKRLAVAASLALLPLLAGCGHGPSYCDRVKEHQSRLGSLTSSGDRTALIRALPIFEDLRAAAPDDVADDWQLVVTRIRAFDTALQHAHVDPTTYDPRHPPADLSSGDRRQIRRAAAELAASDTQEALARVQQEVLDVCHTPLEL